MRLLPSLVALHAIFAACVLCAHAAQPLAPYPNKPIRIIVTFTAGGPTDAVTRVLAHAHFLSDVSVGALLGWSAGWGTWIALRRQSA